MLALSQMSLAEDPTQRMPPPLVSLSNGVLHIGDERLENIQLQTSHVDNKAVAVAFTAMHGERPWRINATVAADGSLTVTALMLSSAHGRCSARCWTYCRSMMTLAQW